MRIRAAVLALIAVLVLGLAACSSSSKSSSNSSNKNSTNGVHVETPDGQVSLSLNGQLPPNWPSSFPVPNGAKAAGSGSLVNGSSGTMIARLHDVRVGIGHVQLLQVELVAHGYVDKVCRWQQRVSRLGQARRPVSRWQRHGRRGLGVDLHRDHPEAGLDHDDDGRDDEHHVSIAIRPVFLADLEPDTMLELAPGSGLGATPAVTFWSTRPSGQSSTSGRAASTSSPALRNRSRLATRSTGSNMIAAGQPILHLR